MTRVYTNWTEGWNEHVMKSSKNIWSRNGKHDKEDKRVFVHEAFAQRHAHLNDTRHAKDRQNKCIITCCKHATCTSPCPLTIHKQLHTYTHTHERNAQLKCTYTCSHEHLYVYTLHTYTCCPPSPPGRDFLPTQEANPSQQLNWVWGSACRLSLQQNLRMRGVRFLLGTALIPPLNTPQSPDDHAHLLSQRCKVPVRRNAPLEGVCYGKEAHEGWQLVSCAPAALLGLTSHTRFSKAHNSQHRLTTRNLTPNQ